MMKKRANRAQSTGPKPMKKSPNNGAHSTGPFSKWFDTDKLCGNPCVCTDAHQELANVKEAIDKNIKSIPSKLYCNPFACTDPRQELASVMEEIDKNIKSIPSDIMFYDDDSFDDSFESSSFQDSITFNSSIRNIPTPTVSQKSGETNAHTSYYVVTALPKEPSHHPDKESVQPLAENKKKKKAVMKEIKANGCANTYGDEGVELVHDGSKAYMKSIGMRKSFVPLHRKRTLRITNQMMVPQQGSGDSTMSLSSDEETYQDDENNLFSDQFFPDQWFDFANFQQDNDEEKAELELTEEMTKEEVKAAKALKKKEEAEAKKEADAKKKAEKQAKKEADAKKKAEKKAKKQKMKKAESERKVKAQRAKKKAEAKRLSEKEAEKQMMKAQSKNRKEQKAEAEKADKKAEKSQKEMDKQMLKKAQRDRKAEAKRVKEEAEAKRQSEKYAEKQMLKWEKYHRKEQKAEAKKAKEEAKKEDKKNKYKEADAEGRQLFSTLNWRRKRNVSDEFDDQNEICVQEVWRST